MHRLAALLASCTAAHAQTISVSSLEGVACNERLAVGQAVGGVSPSPAVMSIYKFGCPFDAAPLSRRCRPRGCRRSGPRRKSRGSRAASSRSYSTRLPASHAPAV